MYLTVGKAHLRALVQIKLRVSSGREDREEFLKLPWFEVSNNFLFVGISQSSTFQFSMLGNLNFVEAWGCKSSRDPQGATRRREFQNLIDVNSPKHGARKRLQKWEMFEWLPFFWSGNDLACLIDSPRFGCFTSNRDVSWRMWVPKNLPAPCWQEYFECFFLHGFASAAFVDSQVRETPKSLAQMIRRHCRGCSSRHGAGNHNLRCQKRRNASTGIKSMFLWTQGTAGHERWHFPLKSKNWNRLAIPLSSNFALPSMPGCPTGAAKPREGQRGRCIRPKVTCPNSFMKCESFDDSARCLAFLFVFKWQWQEL